MATAVQINRVWSAKSKRNKVRLGPFSSLFNNPVFASLMVIFSIQYTGFCRRVGIQISIRYLFVLGDGGGLLFEVVI
jgi:hypothetical protein